MTGLASLRSLAVLEGPSRAETVFGGQIASYAPIAAIWTDIRPTGVRESAEAGAPTRLIETAEGEARSLAAAAPGQRLQAGGKPWRVVHVAPARPKPGRMLLKLERRWP